MHDGNVQDLEGVRSAFTDPEEFWSSPLYRRLSATVATDPSLVALAAHARSGQGPTFAFFGAVHAVLLDGARHPLGSYYPSVCGEAAWPPDDGAGLALVDFAQEHGEELRRLLGVRLVQTNHAHRALALRLGLSSLAPRVGPRPAHLLEVGSSAGLVLRQAAYGYRLGGRAFGDRASPVPLAAEWRSEAPVPDLDAVPTLASTTGIDLNPLDPADQADRRWLQALVWPENRGQAQLMTTALKLAARTPVEILAGDAVERCPQWAERVPGGEPRIVFHCATRMHVPVERRPTFDQAIDDLGRDGPLYLIVDQGGGITVSGPDGHTERQFDADGHLTWANPHGQQADTASDVARERARSADAPRPVR